jgi:hypothetical protein
MLYGTVLIRSAINDWPMCRYCFPCCYGTNENGIRTRDDEIAEMHRRQQDLKKRQKQIIAEREAKKKNSVVQETAIVHVEN